MASAYRWITHGDSPRLYCITFIWSRCNIPKTCVITWLAVLNRFRQADGRSSRIMSMHCALRRLRGDIISFISCACSNEALQRRDNKFQCMKNA